MRARAMTVGRFGRPARMEIANARERAAADPTRASNGPITNVPTRSVVSTYRYSATVEPPLFGSYVTCGTPDDLSTSNGAIDGAMTCGAVVPRALAATLTSIAWHVMAVSGPCVT